MFCCLYTVNFIQLLTFNRCISIIFWFCCCNLWKFSATFSSFVFGIWTYYQYLITFLIFYKISYQELEAWPENFHHNWINNVLYIYIIHNVSLWINQHALPVVSRSIISKMWTNLKVSSTHPTLKLTQASLPPTHRKIK